MRLRKNVFKFFVILAAICIMLPVPSISAAGVLKAVASCSTGAVRAGEPVVVELLLQNVSNEEITYYDFKKGRPHNEAFVITLLVDGRPVVMHTRLDVHDPGYKIIAERGRSWNIPTGPGIFVPMRPVPRKAFVVLKPGEKVAYLKVDLQPVQFKHERRKGVLGPLQIPGEHTIGVEYHNRLDGRKFGLSAWTGKVRSNVITVRVTGDTSPDKLNLEIKNLLSELKKLDGAHSRIVRQKWEEWRAMSSEEKRRITAENLRGNRITSFTSGMEKELRTLSEKTARRIKAFGEPAVPLLLEEVETVPRWFCYYPQCIFDSLKWIGSPSVPYLIGALQAPEAQYIDKIINVLGLIKDPQAVEPLIELYRSKKSGHRHVIATALGRIGDKRATEPLIRSLSEPDKKVAVSAARSLGMLGDERAVEPLIDVLADSHKELVSAAIGSLAGLKDSRAVEPLLRLWDRSDVGDRVKLASALALLGDKRAAKPIRIALDEMVLKAERTGDWDTNNWALWTYAGALGRLKDKQAIPLLKRMLAAGPQERKGGKEYVVAEKAAEALRYLGLVVEGENGQYQVFEKPPKVQTLLNAIALRENEHEWIRWQKIDAMSEQERRQMYSHNMAVFSGLEKELDSMAKRSAEQIAEFGGPIVPVLIDKFRSRRGSERHHFYRCIKSSLVQIGTPAVPHLIKELQSQRRGHLPNVISILGAIKDQRAVEPLLALWERRDSMPKNTKCVIASALGNIGDKRAVEPIIDEFDKTLAKAEQSNKWNRANKWAMIEYARALGTLGDKRAIAVFKRALRAGPQTTKAGKEYLIAEEAAQALCSLGLEVTGDREKGGYRVIETTPPDEASQALKNYLRCVEQRDSESLKQLLCFNDERDRELFIAFSSSRGKIYVRPELFPHGRPVEQKRAADDCWMFVLEDGHLLELWKVDGKWKVLCPFPGRKRMAEAKLTRAETYRYLLAEEIQQVQSESDVQLRRRRQRYLAVLDLSGRHQIKHPAHYFSGIPTNDPAILSEMSNEQFRESVILKLDAPDGLRYRVDPEREALIEGKPVFVTFFIENVTSGAIILEYRPAVEIVDSSNAITARGALVFPRGEKTMELIKSPYRGKIAYPLKKREVKIAPGATFTMRVNLLDNYDLPPARYTISSRIDIDNTEQGYWRGHALSDTISFEIMPLPTSGSPDPNMAIVAGKVTDTASGKGVAGIPVVLGGRAVTATLSDGTYRATNVAPGLTIVGARDKDWYLVPHRQGAISAYYNYLQYEKVSLEAGKETHLDMQVTKGGKIKGTVWDALGKAVPGTIIWIINQREDSSIVAAETREFGNYTSYGLAPGIPLEFLVWTSDGRGSARRIITLEAGEIREVNFILDPENEYRIVGKVSDSSSRGVPNLPMRCWWRERNRRSKRSLYTDNNGNFFFSGLEPGIEYEVYAYGKSAGFDTVNKSVRMLANERTVPLYFYLQKREEEPAAVAIYEKEDVSIGAESYELRVSRILQRLYTAMEKAYADVGLSKEDIQGFFSGQQPPQKAIGKWKAHQEAWPAIVKVRNAAIEEMVSLGPSAVPALLKAKDKSGERRGADIFVFAITKIGKTAVPALIDGLSHVNAVVRARAATSLGKMRDSRAVEPLIRSLSDPDKRVARATVWSLGLLRDTAVTEPLLELWHKEQVVSRTSIAFALGQIGDKRAVKPIMVVLEEYVSQARQTGNWDMNSWAMRVYAGALGEIGDTQAIPLLKKMLDAPHQRTTKTLTPKYLVADAAARALRSLGLEVIGDEEKGGYMLVTTALNTGVKGDIKQEKIGMKN